MKVDRGRSFFLVEGNFHFNFSTFIGRIGEFTVLHDVDDPANLLLRIVLYVPHVRMYDIKAELVDHLVDFLDAFGAGGDLRFQVRDVVIGVASRIRMIGEVFA